MIDQQRLVGLRFDRPRNPLPVLRAEHQRAQDQQIERPLQQGDALAVFTLVRVFG